MIPFHKKPLIIYNELIYKYKKICIKNKKIMDAMRVINRNKVLPLPYSQTIKHYEKHSFNMSAGVRIGIVGRQ